MSDIKGKNVVSALQVGKVWNVCLTTESGSEYVYDTFNYPIKDEKEIKKIVEVWTFANPYDSVLWDFNRYIYGSADFVKYDGERALMTDREKSLLI